MFDKAAGADLSGGRRAREKGFKIPLPMTVEGANAQGTLFKEKTRLLYMSSKGACFYLNNPLAVGTKLTLNISLPPKLAEGEKYMLIIKGRVVFIESLNESASGQRVSIKLDSQYIIAPKKRIEREELSPFR